MKSVVSFLVALAATGASAHMWFEQPVNRAGIASPGGTRPDCNGKAADSGTRTELIAGSTSEMVFRVNQHGPGDGFHLTYSPGKTDNFATGQVLLSGFKYTIPDTGERSVSVKYTVPSTPGDGTLQLKGMGKLAADGTVSGRWYSCADVKIVAPETCPTACETGTPQHGVCQGVTCNCNTGFVGVDCSISVNPNGAVNMELTLNVAGANFVEDKFKSELATVAGVDEARITIINVDTSSPGLTSVVYSILDSTSAGGGPSAVEVSTQLKTAVENDQLNMPSFPVARISTAPPPESLEPQTTEGSDDKEGGGGGNGGAVAAGILVPLFAVGLAVGGFMFYKKKQAGGNRAPMIPPREDAPPLPARV